MVRAHRWWAVAVAAGGIALPAVLLSAPAVTPGIAPPAAHSSAKTAPANSKLVPATSAEQAAREAQRANGGGRVLAVDLTPQGYRVKIIKHGEVRLVVVPAAGH